MPSFSSMQENTLPVPAIVRRDFSVRSAQHANIEDTVVQLKQVMAGSHRYCSVAEGGHRKTYGTYLGGYGIIERPEGQFHIYLFSIDDSWGEYEAIVRAAVDPVSLRPKFVGSTPLFLRTDSGCTSGQVLHDETCECGQQLQIAIGILAQYSEGIVIRIPKQDGRGMGAAFKLATLVLQSRFGLDTVDAARVLAGSREIDKRTYSGVACILKFFNIPTSRPIDLGTNNPLKAIVLTENGFTIARMIEIRAPRTPANEKNLDAKKRELGHDL